LQPIQNAFQELVNAGMFRQLMESRSIDPDSKPDQKLLDELEQKIVNLLREAKRFSDGTEDEAVIAKEMEHKLKAILRLPILVSRFSWPGDGEQFIQAPSTWGTLLSWLFVHALGKVVNQTDFEERSRSWIDEWRLCKTIASVLIDLGQQEADAWGSVTLAKVLTSHQRWFETSAPGENPAYRVLQSLLKDDEVHQLLQLNRFNDILWFNKEAFGKLQWWLFLVAAIQISSDPMRSDSEIVKDIESCIAILQTWQQAEKKSGYQVEKMLQAVRPLTLDVQ